ncbi:MAG: flagellar hook-basal body complex protein FliE [Labilithrix sp.]|nr:flagellar hook-basal body complex protein FliE [Labilithrix sp.]
MVLPLSGPELALTPAEASRPDATTSSPFAPTEGTSVDFSGVLERTVDEANRLHAVAAAKTDALARGASDDLHGTMISVKEAEISMKLVGAVRNKLLDAFHELWRINL